MELISREEVMARLDFSIEHWSKKATNTAKALKVVQESIEEIPKIESRPTGKWMETKILTGTAYSCSICGTLKVHKHNYCEQCGAKMRGEE